MSLTFEVLAKSLNCVPGREQSLELRLLSPGLLLLVRGEDLQVVFGEVLKALQERWDRHLVLYLELLGRPLTFDFIRRGQTLLLIVRGAQM